MSLFSVGSLYSLQTLQNQLRRQNNQVKKHKTGSNMKWRRPVFIIGHVCVCPSVAKQYLSAVHKSITQFDIPICSKEDISSLQVSVNNLIVVEVNQRLQRLFTHNPDLRLCKRPLQFCTKTYTNKTESVDRRIYTQSHSLIRKYDCKLYLDIILQYHILFDIQFII